MAAGALHKDPARVRRRASPRVRDKGRGLLETPPPPTETTFSWGQAQFGFLAPPGGLRGPGLHLFRARGGWAAASRLPPRARPGTRLATAPLLGNRSPSGAPPRPFWEVGSRPGGPPRRSQSMSLGSKEAERRGLPLGTAPATHGGGGSPASPASCGGPQTPFIGQVVSGRERSSRPSSAPRTGAGLPG